MKKGKKIALLIGLGTVLLAVAIILIVVLSGGHQELGRIQMIAITSSVCRKVLRTM